MPTMMVQSAGIRRLRHEIERRRKSELAPTGRVGKKFSAAPHQSSPRCSAPSTTVPRSGALQEDAVPPASHSPRCHRLTDRVVVLALPARVQPPARPSPAADAGDKPIFKKGALVRVRTRLGRLCTGHQLVLWLSAVVVSAHQDGGYLDVLYRNSDFPRDDPSRTVRVSRYQVKMMMPSVAPGFWLPTVLPSPPVACASATEISSSQCQHSTLQQPAAFREAHASISSRPWPTRRRPKAAPRPTPPRRPIATAPPVARRPLISLRALCMSRLQP
ncbi:hypothetical protein ABZP36_001306 [Zizania latifolia]